MDIWLILLLLSQLGALWAITLAIFIYFIKNIPEKGGGIIIIPIINTICLLCIFLKFAYKAIKWSYKETIDFFKYSL